jgi:hypothetical protein
VISGHPPSGGSIIDDLGRHLGEELIVITERVDAFVSRIGNILKIDHFRCSGRREEKMLKLRMAN